MSLQLRQAIQNVFVQLNGSLDVLTNEQYVHQSRILSNATIGQHVRHIVEMFICLEEGYKTGVVNYEKRKRDKKIETEKDFAAALLKQVYDELSKDNKDMLLEATYNDQSNELIHFNTNYYREIAYNLEHTIHHMALIKVGIREVSDMEIPEGFGVASSTIKYKKECAQ
jgi:hypothetical protein